MKKIKESRALSFAVVAFVYIIAILSGIATFRFFEFNWWLSLLIADVAATIVTFIFSLIFGNASVYDPYWSVQPPVIVLSFAFGQELTALGFLLVFAISFWAVRLTANWAYTFGNLTHQDWRYTMLREKTGVFYPLINFIGIHMVPTLVVYGCTLPAVFAILEGLSLNMGSLVFVLLSFCAASMQGIADIQMHKFRKNRTGNFIRTGLWKYSRHPNYLGEILMWWGIALAVICSMPSAWYLMAGAFANTLLFLTVSIPLAEGKQSVKEGFVDYKKQTRMLLPVTK